MANSYIEYTSGLTATTYSVPFNFLSIQDVNVKGYNGTTWSDLTVSSRDATAKTVTLSGAPSAYQKIRVWRNTGSTQLVDFQNGSRLSESDLDTAYQQGLFVAQEVSENASTNIEGIGPQGIQGIKGDKGDKGDQGPKGFVGVQGDTGLQGPKGDIGNTGANGADGADGARGAIGPKGDKGDQGPIGPQGSDGIAGPQGPSGRDGTEVDVSAIKKTIEEDLTGFRNQISSQVSRLAMSGGGGSSGGGGEVWLHRLNDVDYASVKTPSNGQALIYSTSKGKWEAGSAGGGGGGGGSALTIKEEGVSIGTTISEINFIGSTVTASGDSTTITVNSNPDATFIANTVARGLFSTKAESAANTYVNVLLSNTNSYIATVDAQRALDLSNTNSYIASVSGAITVQDEGSALSTAATTLNFVGSGVAATGTGATKTITIAGGSSGIGASGYVSSLLWG